MEGSYYGLTCGLPIIPEICSEDWRKPFRIFSDLPEKRTDTNSSQMFYAVSILFFKFLFFSFLVLGETEST
jgi:hypothetical protein